MNRSPGIPDYGQGDAKKHVGGALNSSLGAFVGNVGHAPEIESDKGRAFRGKHVEHELAHGGDKIRCHALAEGARRSLKGSLTLP
jgi:hypothetical protein